MKNIVIIICLYLSIIPCVAASAPVSTAVTTAQTTNADAKPVVSYTNQENCTQTYRIPSEKLYFLTLSAINANKFQSLEAQTRGGFILFNAGKKQFLATVAKVDDKSSVLKIAPVDNSYYFSPSIVNNIFYYITLNTTLPIETLLKGK